MTALSESHAKTHEGTAFAGWYHSHPGFGCWLSGTDVNTAASFEKLNARSVLQAIQAVETQFRGERVINLGIDAAKSDQQVRGSTVMPDTPISFMSLMPLLFMSLQARSPTRSYSLAQNAQNQPQYHHGSTQPTATRGF